MRGKELDSVERITFTYRNREEHEMGKLIVLYVGCDSDVIDVLQETVGSQFARGAGVSQCPERVSPTNMD